MQSYEPAYTRPLFLVGLAEVTAWDFALECAHAAVPDIGTVSRETPHIAGIFVLTD